MPCRSLPADSLHMLAQSNREELACQRHAVGCHSRRVIVNTKSPMSVGMSQAFHTNKNPRQNNIVSGSVR